MNFLLAFAIGFLLAAQSPAAESSKRTKRILIGVSNVADMGDPEKHEAKNNLWEVAPAYHVFVMYGYEVDFVSPKGGSVPFSHEVDEVDPPGMISYTIKYEGFRDKAGRTMAPDEVDPSKYVGYFVAGGAGPLFDVARNPKILAIASRVYESGGVIGGCGHGPGSLANVKLENGTYVVSGRKVTGFPNSSEKASKWSKGGTLLPFMVEDALRARGGIFQTKDDLTSKFDVVVDRRVVTTMFLSSCANAAREMIDLIPK